MLMILGATSAAHAKSRPTNANAEIEALVAQQVGAADTRSEPDEAKAPYADGAMICVTDGKDGNREGPIVDPTGIGLDNLQGHDEKHVEVQRSRDGRTAWVSFETDVTLAYYGRDPDTAEAVDMKMEETYRVSDVLVQIDGRWRIVASVWSEGVANAEANKAARSRNPPRFTPLPATAKPDASLVAALTAWNGGAVAATAAKRTVVFGSAPGERSTDGAAFRTAWLAGWSGHVGVEPAAIVALAPSGTTGWILADLVRDKGSHKVPFRVLLVFDRLGDGGWQLVHAHFATRGR